MQLRVLPFGTLLMLALPAHGAEASLAEFLDRTYGPGGSTVTRALGKFSSFLNSGKPLPATAASVEGRKPDGSYLWSAMFNPNTARTFAEPKRKIERFCTGAGGSFNQTLPLDPATASESVASVASATASVAALDPRYIMLWRAEGVPEAQIMANWRAGYIRALIGKAGYQGYGWVNGAIEQAQRDQSLGLFTCQIGGQTAWAVSILPSKAYKFQTVAEHERNLLENSWWALAIRAVEVTATAPVATDH